MATDNRKLQLETEVVDGSKAGFDSLKRNAAEAAQSVAVSAEKAGKAVDGIGNGGDAAAKKVEGATRSIIGSIQRTTALMEAGERGSAKYYEALAAQRGVPVDVLKPYIAQLDAVREKQAQAAAALNGGAASLNNVGMSAKQTAFALRGVPAQFTDIFTSLQGGQAPMTVLLQQGGQLKDMFGGIGPAARAMGGYIMGMINPLTLAAAAVAGLGIAMASANSKESEFAGLSVRLSATGRGALSATGDLKKMIEELNRLPGVSRSAAASIIDEFSRVQGVGTEIFKGLGASVANFAAATGTDLPTAAKKLAGAFIDPAKGIKELEAALGTFTAEQILTITKMSELGDKAGANTAMLAALKEATKGLANDAMTPLGRATDGLSNSWDGLMKSVGNSDALKAANVTLGSIIKGVAYLLDVAPKFPTLTAGLAFGPMGAMAAQLGLGAGAVVKAATPNVGVTGSWVAGPTPASELDNQVKDILEATNKYKSTGSEIDRVKAIANQAKEALAGLEKQNRGTSVEAEALRERIGGLNEELVKLGKRGKGAAEKTNPFDAIIKGVNERTAASKLGLEQDEKLTAGQRAAIPVLEALRNGTLKLTQAEAARYGEGLKAELQAEALNQTQQALIKAQKDFEASREKEIVARNNEILKIEEKAQALEDEIAAYGMGKAAIEAMTIARLEEKKAILGGFDGSQERIAQIDAEIAARKRYAADSDKLAGLKAGTQAEEVLRNAKEQAKLYEDEYKLTGLTALERAKVVAQRKVELDYAKKFEELKKTVDGPEKEAARAKLNEAELIEKNAAVSKVVQDEWAKTADQINQSLTDALLRGFESGKDFARNLRDTVVNMFKTLVLRPIISAVMAPVSGVVNAGLNAVGLGGGGAGGLLNTASSANSLYGAASGYSSGVNAAAGFLGAGTTAGASAVSLGYANAVGAVGGDALGALIAGNASWGGVAAGGAATAGAGAAGAGAATAGLAAVPVAGWIALAALAAYSVFAGQKDERFGSQGSYTPGKGTESNGGPNGALDDFGAVSAGNKATATTIDKILERVGSKDRLSYFAGGFESSKNDKGFSYAGGILSNGKVFGQGTDGLGYMNLRGSMSPEEAQARYANELKQATLEALQSATDIPKAISSKLDGVDIEALDTKALDALVATIDTVITQATALQDAFNLLPFNNVKELSFDAAAGLAAASGGFEKLQSNLGVFYENFYGAGEKAAAALSGLTAQFDLLGIALPTSQGALRDLIASQDLGTQAGQQMAASLLNLVPTFYSVSEAARQSAQQMMSILSQYGSAGEQRQFQLEQIRQGLADGGVYVSTEQLGSISRDQAWQAYKDAVAANDNRTADAIYGQLNAFAQVTAGNQVGAFGIGATSSGGGGGGGGGGTNPWKSAADAIVNAIKDLKNSLLQTGPDSFARLQAQYVIDVAKAKAGDLEATQGLPALAKAVASAGKDYGQTALEQALLIGNLIESLDGVIKARGFGASPLLRPGLSLPGLQIPAFAAGGMHTGGWAMVGERGPELVNLGPSRVYNANDTQNMMRGGDDAAVIAELREQNQLLRDILAASQGTRQSADKTAKMLDQAANGGQPLGMMVMT